MPDPKIDLSDIPDVDISDLPDAEQASFGSRFVSGFKHDPLEDKPVTAGSLYENPGGELGRIFSAEHLGGLSKDLLGLGVGLLAPKAIGGVYDRFAPTPQIMPPAEPAPMQRLALPPSNRAIPNENPIEETRQFVGGPSEGSSQVVSRATAEQNPSAFYKVVGSSRTPAAARAANLGEVQEQNRIANLAYGPAEQYPGSRLTIPDKPYELPPESGDTTGGFAPQTGSEMEYPYNVVPNQLRPRAAQTEVLGTTGIKGMSLDDIPDAPRYDFYSPKPEPEVATPKEAEFYTGTGKPAEQLHANRREPASEIIDQMGRQVEAANPGKVMPPLEETLGEHKPPEMGAIPTPGTARTEPVERDILRISAATMSTDRVLASRKLTRPIVDTVRENGWDEYVKGVGTWIRKLGDITDGINSDAQQEAFGRATENKLRPEDQQILSTIPNVDRKLKAYRMLMDDIYAQAKVARGGELGYIKDYLTHIEKLPEQFGDTLKQIFNYVQGKNALQSLFGEGEPLTGKPSGTAPAMYGKGMGHIAESPYVKTRTGDMENIDYRINKIGRMYIDSMARETFLRPAIQKAEEMIKDLPDGTRIKTLASLYVKNITRFDSAAELNEGYKKFTQFMIDTTGRSMMGLNRGLQYLHFLRMGPVWWNLGTRDFANGVGYMLRNSKNAYRETAELGMLPNELYPWKFQTVNERANSFSNFKSMVDFLDRSVAYHGYKTQFERMGLSPEDAMRRAISEAKRVTFTVDPSRANVSFNPEYNVGGSIARLLLQYKQAPAKIVEEVVTTAHEARLNKAKAARMSALLGAAIVSHELGGPDIFHMPTSLTNLSGASITELARIISPFAKVLKKAYDGDEVGAMEEFPEAFFKSAGETALWITPGGKAIQREFTGK